MTSTYLLGDTIQPKMFARQSLGSTKTVFLHIDYSLEFLQNFQNHSNEKKKKNHSNARFQPIKWDPTEVKLGITLL